MPTTKIPTNVTGTIAPLDSDDFVSMQLRYVTMETLERLGYVQYEEQIVQSPPRPMVSAKNQRAAPIPKAREQPMASSRQLPQKILAPLVAPTPQVVGEVQVSQNGMAKSHGMLTIETGVDSRHCDHEQDFDGQVAQASEWRSSRSCDWFCRSFRKQMVLILWD